MAPNYDLSPISLASINQYVVGDCPATTSATEIVFVWSPGDALLTFAISADFARDAASRPNVACVLVDSEVEGLSADELKSAKFIRVSNARLNFFRLQNSLREKMSFQPNDIAPTASVHPTATIDSEGVVIGEHTVIEAGATIQSGTRVGNHCVIRAGVHLGSDALDIKKDEDGNPYMTDHLGSVVIEDHVEIGHNSVVDRSIFRQTATTIGAHTKIGCLSNISHGVRLGERNMIAAGVKICGSTVVGDDNWVGPGAIVSNLLTVGSRNYIALGAHVLANLEDDWKVVGIRVFKDRKLF